jgi:hypothetical protein
VLDFNFAYNPSCAYDPRWVCPLARLPFARFEGDAVATRLEVDDDARGAGHDTPGQGMHRFRGAAHAEADDARSLDRGLVRSCNTAFSAFRPAPAPSGGIA